MIATISLGSCVSVQGTIVRLLQDGRLTVRVGRKVFTGKAIAPPRPLAPRLPQVQRASA